MKQITTWVKISIFFMGTLIFPSILQAATVIYQAEDAVLNGVSLATNHAGYTGSNFGDYASASTDYMEWTVDAANAGTYLLNFRYALASGNRPLVITVNGIIVESSLSFPSTGSWSTWDMTADLSVTLNQGTNIIRATAANSNGANVDRLDVSEVVELSITKYSNVSGDILPGETFKYTIVVKNGDEAKGDATNVTVRDPLPSGVIYVSGSAEKTYYIDGVTTSSFSYDMGSIGFTDNNGVTQTYTVTPADIPTGSILIDYAFAVNGTSNDWRSDISLDAGYPGGIAYQVDRGVDPDNDEFGGNSAGTWNTVSRGPGAFSGTALGDYTFTWYDAVNWTGNDNTVTSAEFTINYSTTSRVQTTDPANDPSPAPSPSFMVTAADNITLKPGETLIVTFQVKADDNLNNIPNITNIAFAAATEMTTEINASTTNTTLPVTISYAYPQLYGNTLDLDFGTATETGNVGFNIYTVKGKGKRKKWIKLNKELIPGALDSFEPQDYHTSVEIPEGLKVKKIGIAGVDVNGKEDRHGPYKIGKESGEKTVTIPVSWNKVKTEVKKERNARKAVRKAARKMTRDIFKENVVILNVKEKAVYKITDDDLLAQGINLKGLKANTIAISLKGKGVARHILGVNKSGKWTKESSIEFRGERVNAVDALYVDINRYKLSLNKTLVVESEDIEPLTQKEIVIDNNNKYSYSMPLNDPFFEGVVYTLNAEAVASYTSTFDMPVVPQNGTSHVSIYAAVTSKGSHNMSVALNGTPVADSTAQDRSTWIIEQEVDNALLQEKNNELTLTLYGEDDGMDIMAYDKLIISYDEGGVFPSQTPQIELDDKVSKKDIRVKRGTDYLIISHPLFINESLDNYVQTRQSEGWKIQVVNVEDIYSVYTNGMAVPEAIKTYITEASNKSVTHVELVGASSHDNLNYLGTGSMSLIPALYTLTNSYIQYTPSDTLYVLDEDGLPTIAIGRWPVHTLEEFENVVSKTLSYQPHNQEALLITDQVDNEGTDFKPQMNRMAEVMEQNGYGIKKVDLDTFNEEDAANALSLARDAIQRSMTEGISILSYSGHGASTKWSLKGLLKQEDIATTMSDAQTAPIALPFTCMATYADSPYSNTIAHQLLANTGGAVAVYGATTYSSYEDNNRMIGEVFKNLIKGQTLGEAIKNKKQELGAKYRDVIMNGNLLGDVTLKIGNK